MTMTMKNRIDAIARTISQQIGTEVEITIRGDRSFTFSTNIVQYDLEDKIRAFFGDALKLNAESDPELGTFCYAEA